jgi:predicted neuraminidase
VAQWNPVVFWEGDDLQVFSQVGESPSTWRTVRSRRTPDGWSHEPCVGPDGSSRGPVRNHVVACGGILFAGASVEDRRPWASAVDSLAPDATFWQRSWIPGADDVDLIQPALAVIDGVLVALLRSSGGRGYLSRRRADGTWSAAVPTDLPNNNSGLDVATTPAGALLAVGNASTIDWGPRCPLLLFHSRDALTWRPVAIIDDGRWAPGDDHLPPPHPGERFDGSLDGRGEYSYPSIDVSGDRVLVSYTWQRRAIALAHLSLTAIGVA